MAPYILAVLKDDDILPILEEMSRWIKRKRKRINLKK
jgi:L-lactate utilization protein LutC